MVYRSRYLNRLMFSPPSYRERFRQVEPRAETPWVEAPRLGTSAPVTAQEGLGGRAPYLSSRELRDTLSRCKRAIMAGSARIEDYEAFIICQQELASR